MSKIIIDLSKNDIGNLLLGGEITITPSVHRFDNLIDIVIKSDDYIFCSEEEVVEDD